MTAGAGDGTTPLRSNADYRRWWLGNLASSTGDQLVLVAFPLMVLLLTRSAFQAGLVASLSALPFIVLTLPVGELVDRVSRRLVLVASCSVSLLAPASIAAAYWCGVLTAAQLLAVRLPAVCRSRGRVSATRVSPRHGNRRRGIAMFGARAMAAKTAAYESSVAVSLDAARITR